MDLHVRRMKSRYRLPTSGRAVASRLDAIASGLVGDALSVALARDAHRSSSGLDAHAGEEICVRHARVALRVRASEGDVDLAARWGAAAADSIRSVVSEADPSNVVRYASRAQALADFASGAARGDLERQWAWRQLGLWRAPASPSLTTARAELLRALIAHPTAVVPTLAALARRGALRPLVTTWSPAEIRRLAETALLAANAPTDILAEPEAASRIVDTTPAAAHAPRSAGSPEAPTSAEGANPVPEAAPPPAGATPGATGHLAGVPRRAADRDVYIKAARALAASPLGAFAVSARDLPAASLESLAVIAALDFEPTTLRAGKISAERIVRAMLEALRHRHGVASAAVAHNTGSPLPRAGEARRPAVPARIAPRIDARLAAQRASTAAPTPDLARPASSLAPAPGASDAPAPGASDAPAPRASDAPATRASDAPATSPATAKPADPRVAVDTAPGLPLDDAWDRDRRERGTTKAGGLLFLLHIVGELGLADGLADSPALGARPMRWALHQLALLLGEVADDDPAALAFAGLGPGVEPPSAHEEPATTIEHEALLHLVSRVVTRLEERLAPTAVPGRLTPPSSSRRDAEAADLEAPDARAAARELLLRVTRRHAEILADPGWIEVRLFLDEVRTDVRRAGLDLDPDHLPWLGVVVRFTYA